MRTFYLSVILLYFFISRDLFSGRVGFLPQVFLMQVEWIKEVLQAQLQLSWLPSGICGLPFIFFGSPFFLLIRATRGEIQI